MGTMRIDNLRSLLPFISRKNLAPDTDIEYRGTEVSEMAPGQEGYIVSWALHLVVRGEDVEWYIKPDYPVRDNPGGTVDVKVRRNRKGLYEATLPAEDGWGRPYAHKWNPVGEPRFEWFPTKVTACFNLDNYLQS